MYVFGLALAKKKEKHLKPQKLCINIWLINTHIRTVINERSQASQKTNLVVVELTKSLAMNVTNHLINSV